MYCPVCGAEYVEGILRCPDDDVELVEELPSDFWEEEESPSLLERFDRRLSMRIVFLVLLAAAVLYALSGIAESVLTAMIVIREWHTFDPAQVAGDVARASFRVGLGAFGVLAGGLAIETFLRLTTPRRVDNESSSLAVGNEPGDVDYGANLRWWHGSAMRFLFALFILFASIWIVTSVAISEDEGDRAARPFVYYEQDAEEPSDTLVTLYVLRYASFTVGVGIFAIMAATLIVQAYRRLTQSSDASGRAPSSKPPDTES